LHRVLAGDVPAVGVTRTGATFALPGADTAVVLADGSAAIGAAHAMLAHGGDVRRFLWPSPARGEWYAMAVIPCSERAMPGVCGVVTARPRADVHGLTPREVEVLTLLAAGLSNADIAARLVVSPRTVSKHVEQILLKLEAPSRGAAAARAIDEGLLLPTPRR
jgi:branched-chain amino acid transport system substrate-binding protein